MASMTPQQAWYWARWHDQVNVFISMMEDTGPHAAQAIERLRRNAYGATMMSARERAAWEALYQLQHQFERFSVRLCDTLRAVTNMVNMAEWMVEHGERPPCPESASRVTEKPLYSLAEHHRQRETYGPEQLREMGRPAAPTTPMEGNPQYGREPIDTGHPLARAEGAAGGLHVVRAYGDSSALG